MDKACFFDRVKALDTGNRAALRRAAGTMLSRADGKAYAAFYQAYPPKKEPEDKLFFAACLQCMWNPDDLQKTVQLEQAGNMMEENDKKTFLKRVEGLLDVTWEQDGYMAAKLFRLVKFVKSKKIAVDCSSLYEDLKKWNSPARFIQRQWAMAVCGTLKSEDESD